MKDSEKKNMLKVIEPVFIAPRTADNLWAYARAWLAVRLGERKLH
jgi:hypothetical protein